MKKLIIFPAIALSFLLVFGVSIALAQDDSTPTLISEDVIEEVAIDEEVTAEDLGIEEPRVLPNSPWYGLKKFWEGIKDTFVFNPIRKAEVSLDRASERLIEIQASIEAGEIKNPEKSMANYERHISNIQERIAKLDDVHSDKAEKFLDKFAQYQIKHRLLSLLEHMSHQQLLISCLLPVRNQENPA